MRCCPMAESINFRTDVFTHTRWLFSYGATFLPDARGNMLFYSVCSLCVVRPTYRASHRHKNSYTIQLFWVVGALSFLADGSITLVL